MVHPKGHIMARIEDLFVRTAVVREGAMGDSQALERGAEIPEGTQERVPDRSLHLCWIAPSLRAVSTAPAHRGKGPFSKAVAAAALLCDSSTSAPPGTWDPWSWVFTMPSEYNGRCLGEVSFKGHSSSLP